MFKLDTVLEAAAEEEKKKKKKKKKNQKKKKKKNSSEMLTLSSVHEMTAIRTGERTAAMTGERFAHPVPPIPCPTRTVPTWKSVTKQPERRMRREAGPIQNKMEV